MKRAHQSTHRTLRPGSRRRRPHQSRSAPNLAAVRALLQRERAWRGPAATTAMTPPNTRTEIAPTPLVRPSVRGKSLHLGERKLRLRGVTYGPFSSEPSGGFDPETAARDFAQMAAHGINAVRVYTAPERWLLDTAHEH